MKRISGGILSLFVAVAVAGSAGIATAQESGTVQPPLAPAAETEAGTPAATPKSGAAKTSSACKGLEEKPCRLNTSCYWIAASTGKDGSDVAAHCKGKKKNAGAKKPAGEAPAPSPTVGPETTPPAAGP